MKPRREEVRRHSGPVVDCIVGAGAAGSTHAKECGVGGLSGGDIEAGKWYDTKEDIHYDELEMYVPLNWDVTRISVGSDLPEIGRMSTGRAVGGSTVHYTAMKLRLHPDDYNL